MPTHDDDMIRLHTSIFGVVDFPMKKTSLEWPPPEHIIIDEHGLIRAAEEDDEVTFILKRNTMSQLTYEQADNPHLVRGASYSYLTAQEREEWRDALSVSSGEKTHAHVTSPHGTSSEELG